MLQPVDQRLWKWLQFFQAGSIGHEEPTLVGQSHGCGSGTKAQRGEKTQSTEAGQCWARCLMLGLLGFFTKILVHLYVCRSYSPHTLDLHDSKRFKRWKYTSLSSLNMEAMGIPFQSAMSSWTSWIPNPACWPTAMESPNFYHLGWRFSTAAVPYR